MINDRPSASWPMLNRFHAYYALHSSDQAAQVLLQRGMHAVTSTRTKTGRRRQLWASGEKRTNWSEGSGRSSVKCAHIILTQSNHYFLCRSPLAMALIQNQFSVVNDGFWNYMEDIAKGKDWYLAGRCRDFFGKWPKWRCHLCKIALMLCLKERMLKVFQVLHSFGTLGSPTNYHTHDLYEKCQSILSLQQLQLWFLTQSESLGHDARREGRGELRHIVYFKI